jgi:ribulose 1,5-bisphosphate synthetase/thiazole synthase
MIISKRFYTEVSKQLPVIDEVDVLVVGGGPSGVPAAIGAAREGVKTMVVENMGSFGGMWTNGLVITLAGFNNWLRPYQRVVKGITEEWIIEAEKLGGAENNRSWVLSSDPEIMKLVADRMLAQAGVKCLLHTWVADVIVEGNVLKGVIVENVDGRSVIMAKCVVDCTGNGDVFARANESYIVSDELQPMTLPFFLADFEKNGSLDYEDELVVPMGPEPDYLSEHVLKTYTSRRRDVEIDRSQLLKESKEGRLPVFGGPWFGGLRTRFPWVNTTRIYGSAINAQDLTAAEIQGRENVNKIVSFYRQHCKGFENAWVMKTASTMGIRETRRLDGVFTITGKDIHQSTRFDDSIALGVWPIDVHPPKGHVGMHKMFVPLPYQIPYRTLLPKSVDNLIVAGRCISADREAMGSIRVGATCGAIGHAAGIAAAHSSRTNRTPRDLPVKDLQQSIIRQKGLIDI